MPYASPSNGDAFSLGLSSHLCPRGDGQSRMLETLAKHRAHAPLPASRLDMRACHPAEKLDRVALHLGFPRPAPTCLGSRTRLLGSAKLSSQISRTTSYVGSFLRPRTSASGAANSGISVAEITGFDRKRILFEQRFRRLWAASRAAFREPSARLFAVKGIVERTDPLMLKCMSWEVIGPGWLTRRERRRVDLREKKLGKIKALPP